jgi:hypothetical protein
MPKDNISYSNTIIYKIYCKDDTIIDIYIGHTTNFFVRKYQHKCACNNSKNLLKIYKTIRENGGWNNWNMVEIAKYNCKDSTEARIKEQIHYEELNASLNSCPPYVDNKTYFCLECNIQCTGPKNFSVHITSKSHVKNKNNKVNLENANEQLSEKSLKTSNYKYNCDTCDYNTCNFKDYKKHLITSKHQRLIKTKNIYPKVPDNKEDRICECGKSYRHMSSLCKHKRTCELIVKPIQIQINKEITPELIIELINQNKELHKTIVEQNKTIIELANKVGTNKNISI